MTTAIISDLREILVHRFKTAPLRELIEAAESPVLPAFPVENGRAHAVRFEIVHENAVLDHETGLTWSRDYVPGGERNWKDSMDAAERFDLNGWRWRAPTIRELLTLVDYERHDPAIDTDALHGGSNWVRSSTVDHSSPGDFAWSVFFYNGGSFRYAQSSLGYVRAVRVGQ